MTSPQERATYGLANSAPKSIPLRPWMPASSDAVISLVLPQIVAQELPAEHPARELVQRRVVGEGLIRQHQEDRPLFPGRIDPRVTSPLVSRRVDCPASASMGMLPASRVTESSLTSR